jgi:hypothetical protein
MLKLYMQYLNIKIFNVYFMAIFIFKIIAVVVRTVAKPLITWATYYNRIKIMESNYKYEYIKEKIIWIGQISNYYNTKFNRKVFRLPSTDPIKKLSDDKAIEKGAEFISEFLIYSILLSIPILEWWRQSNISKVKEEIKETSIKRMRNDIEIILDQNSSFKEQLKEIRFILNTLNDKL